MVNPYEWVTKNYELRKPRDLEELQTDTSKATSANAFSWITKGNITTKLAEGAARILDVGCGVGRTTLELASMVPEGEVVGIDINPALTACANQLAQLFEFGSRIRFFAGDLVEKGTIPKDEVFDLIYCCQWNKGTILMVDDDLEVMGGLETDL